MESEAFRRWRDAFRRSAPTRSSDDDDDEDDDAKARATGATRFERAADYLAHYVRHRTRRRTREDYVAYCLCMCERARDERDARGEFYYYGELVRADARAGRRGRGRGEGERARDARRELVDLRLRRVMDLGFELEGADASAGARAHLVASEYYAWFRENCSEAALEHAGLALRLAKASTDGAAAVEQRMDALRVMKSTQAREGNMYEAVALGSRFVALARSAYHAEDGCERTVEDTVRFVERLFEHALTLRGWRERPARPLTAPELERYAADVLKEAKSALEEAPARTSTPTAFRAHAGARKLYVAVLCHLADLCENHLDSSHVIVDDDDIEAFSHKSRHLHRALAVGYRTLASTVAPRLFERPCCFCGLPLVRDGMTILDDASHSDRDAVALVTLACDAREPHHFHVRCRLAAVDADEAHVDRSLERGLPCRFCVHGDDDSSDDDEEEEEEEEKEEEKEEEEASDDDDDDDASSP